MKALEKMLGSVQSTDELSTVLKANYENINSKNLCAGCWSLCSRYQWIKHKEAGHSSILTPRWFKDADSFMKLAEKCHKFQDITL